MVNNNKPMVDMPCFELCNQLPTATNALTTTTTSELGTNRFIYCMISAVFYRYDTIADTWQLLATPNTAPVTVVSMRHTGRRGYHGRVLAASSTSVTIPGLRGSTLNGYNIEILSGTGQGQKRLLTYTGETIHEAGVITGTTTSSLVDTVKKWRINQWAGYLVGITFGTDTTQYKKILYNDATTLYIADANLQPHDPWNNQPFVAVAPYALPVVTAGLQAHYQIMSSTFTVPAWTTVPDYTSFFTTDSGGIYLVSSAAAAPFFTLQYYDIAHDSWQTKTVPQSLILAALGTDVTTERTGKLGTVAVVNSGVVSGTARTLNDAGLTMEVGRYINYRLCITAGTGIGQTRRIVSNTATAFTVNKNWDTNPDATTTFEVWSDYDKIYLSGGAAAAMYAYSPENDFWMQGNSFDDGVTCNISCSMKGWMPHAVVSGTRIAAGIQAVNPVPTAGGSGYTLGDILTCNVGGSSGAVIVTSTGINGAVTGIALIHSGLATGYTTGSGKATSGGTGTLCTIQITVVGPTATITTTTAHWYATGQSVTFAGLSEGLWNAEHTIVGVSSTTVFSVSTTATASMIPNGGSSAITVYDPTKNWVVNEHVGRLVHVCVAGTAPTSQVRWITANTATTLTVATIVLPGNGTSKYAIYDSKIFGIDNQRKETNMHGYGQATGGSTTTLIDSTKNWIPDQWKNYVFKVEAGVGYGSGRITITNNTATTLTYTTQSFTPDATTRYEIADTWGLITAGGTTTPVTETGTKNWVVNQWAGKRFRITGGTAMGQEAAVVSNTATALTLAAITLTDATSTYAILAIPARGAGIEMSWVWGNTDADKRARYIYVHRGSASNTFDIYDIVTGRWNFGNFYLPQSETFAAGSSYTYDGVDSIYLSKSVANQAIRVFKYNVNTNTIVGAATTTTLQGTVTIGNMMEIVDSPDGTLSYLYCFQNTGTLLSRALIF